MQNGIIQNNHHIIVVYLLMHSSLNHCEVEAGKDGLINYLLGSSVKFHFDFCSLYFALLK